MRRPLARRVERGVYHHLAFPLVEHMVPPKAWPNHKVAHYLAPSFPIVLSSLFGFTETWTGLIESGGYGIVFDGPGPQVHQSSN